MTARTVVAAAAIALVALVGGACSAFDPVHADQVDALGNDPSGERNGPLHRPGQPCRLCHDGTIGNPSEFVVAGTVYATPDGNSGADGVSVVMTGANGSSHTAVTNSAGNFYVSPREWSPVYPLTVSIAAGGSMLSMKTLVGRDGSCNGCHVAPAGPSSPGHVALALDDGGTPP